MPPPTYKLDPMQLPPGLQANAPSGNATSPAAMPGNASVEAEPGMMSPRQACSTGYLCPATTLPSGCSRTGNRWRAPSCKCYDTPLTSMMSGKPPAGLAINSAGQWIDRRNGNLMNIQVCSPSDVLSRSGTSWPGQYIGDVASRLMGCHTNVTPMSHQCHFETIFTPRHPAVPLSVLLLVVWRACRVGPTGCHTSWRIAVCVCWYMRCPPRHRM